MYKLPGNSDLHVHTWLQLSKQFIYIQADIGTCNLTSFFVNTKCTCMYSYSFTLIACWKFVFYHNIMFFARKYFIHVIHLQTPT